MEMDFLSQVLEYIKAFGGLETVLKISGGIAIIISSMKVTFSKQLLWDKLGAAQAWLAPALGLLVGILSMGTALTLASALAYVGSGAGAILFHELLDTLKVAPVIGDTIVKVIAVIQALLNKKPTV